MKKFILTIFIVCLAFSFNVSAKKIEYINDLKPQGEFYNYPEQADKAAKALGMDKFELRQYCLQNGVVYFAVDKDNTKQIKVTVETTDFSNSVINISGLSNDSITALIPDITGIENAKGEVITKDGQKFVKTQFKTEDSGGEYILTQYFTVANRTNIVLSFYTEKSLELDYIDKTFESFSSPLFITEKNDKSAAIESVVLVTAVIFGIACVVITFTIIRDIKKDKKESSYTEESKENDN